MKNCRNCGAPPSGKHRCEYCGTVDSLSVPAAQAMPIQVPYCTQYAQGAQPEAYKASLPSSLLVGGAAIISMLMLRK